MAARMTLPRVPHRMGGWLEQLSTGEEEPNHDITNGAEPGRREDIPAALRALARLVRE